MFSLMAMLLDPLVVIPGYIAGLYARGRWLLLSPFMIVVSFAVLMFMARIPFMTHALIYLLASAGWVSVGYMWRRFWHSRWSQRDDT